jgi:probable F420-dependent oxidoreductase
MKIGFNMPQLTEFTTRRTIHEFAVRADELGYDSLYVQDHYLYPEAPLQSHPMQVAAFGPEPVRQWQQQYQHVYSPLESLAYVAAITKHVRVGASVMVIPYHRPAMLAKRVATIDVLSQGRFDLGLGLGWAREEFAHMDSPYDEKGPRGTDFIRALRAAWMGNPTEYNGPYFNFPRGRTSPKPVQRDRDGNPAVPILGAFMSDAGLRRTAELCDVWHPAGHPIDRAVTRWQEVNRIAKDEFGRAPLAISYRVFAAPALPGIENIAGQLMQPNWVGTPDDMLPRLKECKEAGFDEVVIDTSFFNEMTGEDDWLAQPDFFEPLLKEAHR